MDCRIDFENKTISIKRKVTNQYGNGTEEIIFSNKMKSDASRRILPLMLHIEKMLLEEKKKQAENKRRLKGGYCDEDKDFVCRDCFGKLIKPNYITGHFSRMIDKHKLDELTFHGLRHPDVNYKTKNNCDNLMKFFPIRRTSVKGTR